MRGRSSLFSALALSSFVLAGCVRYVARPVSPTAIVAAQAAREFDPALVAARLRALAPAAPFDPARWDRLSLFAAAVDGNADVAVARAAVVRAMTEARAAHAPAGPTLALTTEYAGAAPEASPWLFGGAVNVPLDVGGVRSTRIDSASLKTAMVRYDYLEVLWTARLALRTSLINRMIAMRQADAGRTLTALRERHFAAVSRRVAAGETTRADLERVRADLADTRRRSADADARVNAETRAISALTGISFPMLTGAAVVWDGFDSPPTIGLSDVPSRRAALVARADILRVVAAYDQSEANLRGEVARQYPAISIGPGFTWERGLVKLPFSIGLALPPLDLNRRAIATAEAKRAEAGRMLEAAIADATAAIDVADGEASAARTALTTVRRDELPAAQRLAAQAERELRAGAIDRTDWAAAQEGALVARLAELDALARVHNADTALELALRRPLEGPELSIATQAGGLQ
jgi:outer membrane protein TolC